MLASYFIIGILIIRYQLHIILFKLLYVDNEKFPDLLIFTVYRVSLKKISKKGNHSYSFLSPKIDDGI